MFPPVSMATSVQEGWRHVCLVLFFSLFLSGFVLGFFLRSNATRMFSRDADPADRVMLAMERRHGDEQPSRDLWKHGRGHLICVPPLLASVCLLSTRMSFLTCLLGDWWAGGGRRIHTDRKLCKVFGTGPVSLPAPAGALHAAPALPFVSANLSFNKVLCVEPVCVCLCVSLQTRGQAQACPLTLGTCPGLVTVFVFRLDVSPHAAAN